MTQVEIFELSAYLDGELTKERARIVEAAIAANPVLREEYAALSEADARWRAAANTARFTPKTAVLPNTNRVWTHLAGGVLLLLGVRLLPKLAASFELNVLLSAIFFSILLAWAVRLEKRTRALI